METKMIVYIVETQNLKTYVWYFHEGEPNQNDYGNGIYIGVTSPSGDVSYIDCRYIQNYVFEDVCRQYLENYYGKNLKDIW